MEVRFHYKSSKPIFYIWQIMELEVVPLVGDIIRLIPNQCSKKLKNRSSIKSYGAKFKVTEREIYFNYSEKPNPSSRCLESPSNFFFKISVEPLEELKDE